MKVLLINGSPNKNGCTYTALCEVAGALKESGAETEIFHIGVKPIRGCVGCGCCRNLGKCVFDEDKVNQAIDLAAGADALVLGSPVHYASASGGMTAFLDRFFYACSASLAGKPCACVASCRRAGSTAALDQLQKYPLIAGMPLVASQYWNMVHGSSPEEVRQDLEGMQTMRALGRNMAWLLECIKAGKEAGIGYPAPEPRVRTNFIR